MVPWGRVDSGDWLARAASSSMLHAYGPCAAVVHSAPADFTLKPLRRARRVLGVDATAAQLLGSLRVSSLHT
jgi:hypothetical protein